jgi:dipeptidyl-peptidase-4
MKKVIVLALAVCCLIASPISAQEKLPITLEDVFKKGSFRSAGIGAIRWMNDGRYYSAREVQNNLVALVKKDITTGQTVETIATSDDLGFAFGAYTFSSDEQKLILPTQTERIYRRSSKSVFYIYDIATKTSQVVANGEKVMYATFSPDASKIAYVKDNNLYMASLSDMQEIQITQDGEWNKVINGNADWVYEEEFSMSKAFEWSPDGSKIAFWRFDESGVKEYNMQLWGSLYPQDYKFKYPKAGEDNSVVELKVFDLQSNQITTMDIGEETDIYIPRIYWTKEEQVLSMIRLNRLQNKMEILHANVNSGESKVIYSETSETYVDADYNDNLQYLNDGKTFIITSEKDGFKHIYQYNLDGSLVKQITSGNWEVTDLLGVNEANKMIYFLSSEKTPLERHMYSIKLNGKGKKEMTFGSGTYRINWSPDYKYYIQTFSSVASPNIISLHDAKGKEIRVMEDNAEAKERISQYALGQKEFFTFENEEGLELNGYMIKPANFDPSKKYPVLMYVYGGPGSQTVSNSWYAGRDYWHMYLANQGYIIASIDNRGTGARGKDFKHKTYGILGKYEVEDQIAGGKYLASLDYTDPERIGIWGWSYGGYMSSLSLFIGNDVFKSAIAVAPVTSWRYYDTIYTERYMSTPQLNGEGYDAYSPNSHIDKLKGNFLLIHGTGDDNVHFQNAVEMLDRLVAANKQFDTFYYPNRNHGIYGGNTTWHLYNQMTNWLIDNL